MTLILQVFQAYLSTRPKEETNRFLAIVREEYMKAMGTFKPTAHTPRPSEFFKKAN